MTASILVLGLGNVLLRDDGVGVRVVESLQQHFAFPATVALLDGGTLGLDLLPWLDGLQGLVVVDAVAFGRAPGQISHLEGADVRECLHLKMSPHQVGLRDLLAAASLLGRKPARVVLWGAEPERLDPGTELSPTVAGALPALRQAVVNELRSLGAAPLETRSVASS